MSGLIMINMVLFFLSFLHPGLQWLLSGLLPVSWTELTTTPTLKSCGTDVRTYNDQYGTFFSLLPPSRIAMVAVWLAPCIMDRVNNSTDPEICIWEPSKNPEFVIFIAVVGHHLPCFIMVGCYIKVFAAMRKRNSVIRPQLQGRKGSVTGDYINYTGTTPALILTNTHPATHYHRCGPFLLILYSVIYRMDHRDGKGWESVHQCQTRHLTETLLNGIITAQWEGIGDVGLARYEPALLPPWPTFRALSYSNCQGSTHSISKWIFRNLSR